MYVASGQVRPRCNLLRGPAVIRHVGSNTPPGMTGGRVDYFAASAFATSRGGAFFT